MNERWIRHGRAKSGSASEQDVIGDIAAEFPHVSRRIIADVLAAYCSRSRNMPAAAEATRERIKDACATLY